MTTYNQSPVLLDVKAVAALLQSSTATVWRRANDQTLPQPIRIGGMTRWARDEIYAVIEHAKAARDEASKAA
jgi:predicted DNA-binding transcriptional regulator AlpA